MAVPSSLSTPFPSPPPVGENKELNGPKTRSGKVREFNPTYPYELVPLWTVCEKKFVAKKKYCFIIFSQWQKQECRPFKDF